MSFEITPPAAIGYQPTASTPPPRATGRPTTSYAATAASVARADSAETLPSTPPPEIYDAMARADAAYRQLQGQGYQVSFEQPPGSARIEIAIRNGSGETIRTISPSQALSIADGTPPSGTPPSRAS